MHFHLLPIHLSLSFPVPIIMSVRHSNHTQSQSLPPFAVAFSNSSLDKLSSHPASLPPIQPRLPSDRPRSLPDASQSAPMSDIPPIPNGRKRSHPDAPQRDDTSSDNRYVPRPPSLSRSSAYASSCNSASNSTSPRLGRVKTEHDDQGDDSPSHSRQPRSHPPSTQQDPASRSMPPSAPSPQSQPSPRNDAPPSVALHTRLIRRLPIRPLPTPRPPLLPS